MTSGQPRLWVVTYWLMIAMVFTLPWEGEVDIPGFGQVSRFVGILVGLSWLALVIQTRRMREPHTLHIFGLLFVIWNAFSSMWTVDGPVTEGTTLTYAQLVVLTLLLWDMSRTLADVRRSLLAYLAGCYVSIGSLLLGYATEGQASEMHGRVTISGFHPNDIGLVLALAVPVAGYFLDQPGTGPYRRLRLVAAGMYLPVASFAVLITGSRAGLGAMLPGVLYLGYLLARRRPAVAAGGVVGLVGLTLILLPLVPPRVVLRLEGTGAAVDGGDLNERTEIWNEAVRIFRDHPLTGIGGGAFKSAAVAVNKNGHNFVLALLAEVGIIGFGLFAALLVIAVLALRRQDRLLAGMWAAFFAAWLFAGLLHNWEERKQTWFMLAMMVATGALERSRGGAAGTQLPDATADTEVT